MNTRVAVKESALFLDRVTPDWFHAIHLPSLDVQDPDTCIVGQVYGRNYQFHIRQLRDMDANEFHAMTIGEYGAARGFCLDGYNPKTYTGRRWRALTALWRDQIEMRLNLTQTSGPTTSGTTDPSATGHGRRILGAILLCLGTCVTTLFAGGS